MISESDKQLLYSLKSNNDFLCFLEAVNSSINEYENVLQEVIGMSNGTRPFYSPFIGEAQQLDYDIVSSITNKIQTSRDFNFNKKSVISLVSSEEYSETEDSLHQSSRGMKPFIFKVIPDQKPGKLKISLRTDCIRKKTKSMFHKFILTKLNNLLHQSSDSSFKPLPKILSISLNLSENKQWTEMTLRELMMSNNIKQSGFDTMNKLHNLKVLIEENKSENLEAYLDTKWKTIFEEFLLSSELSNAITEMEKSDKIYAFRFRKHSSSLLKFIEH